MIKDIIEAVRGAAVLGSALQFHKEGKGVNVTGLANSAKSVFCVALAQSLGWKTLLICVPTREEVKFYEREMAQLCPDLQVTELYPRNLASLEAEARNLEVAAARTAALRCLQGQSRGLVFVTAESLLQKQRGSSLMGRELFLETGQVQDLHVLLQKLTEFGYERVDQVETRGQFAVRGSIVDIFAVGDVHPTRLEFFDDSIDGIRYFDVETQRGIENCRSLKVLSLLEEQEGSEQCFLTELCAADTGIILDEAGKLGEMLERLDVENLNFADRVFSSAQVWEKINGGAWFALGDLQHKRLEKYVDVHVQVRQAIAYNHNVNLIQQDLGVWQQEGKTIFVLVANSMKARAFADSLHQQGFRARYGEKDWEKGWINVGTGALEKGFGFLGADWVVLTENDLFGIRKKYRSPYAKHQGAQLQYFKDIKAGDYVVHGIHGIGRYTGVETFEDQGLHRDYLVIVYEGDAKLYVPVDQVGMLHKYVGSEGTAPRLSKMGGADWAKIKSRAAKAITILAAELLQLYAQRQALPGHAFGPDTQFQRDFEASFPFEETPDQLKSIQEIKKDMESPKPMDRLLCGDVGFGKTEVALRAAFKAVMDGKQVAVLAPTTVLAQQHYLTFRQRMQGFGPNVALMNRFTGRREQKRILADLAAGTVDVVIGTHRILQSDVVFKDLGLLIIDEEQRFGVGQKEKIKKWRTGIDVLALSATPIPRTLHMALVNSRDMSVIETPPEDRLPVETYVMEYDDRIVKEAIERELRRGGQIYYVHNRIDNLPGIEQRLLQLVPGVRLETGHGRMRENQLEDVMLDFYQGDVDLLLCTTIVENGLDVPRANTIIIDGADNFGLSQLYQMRGRVGRSDKLAYAYLLYRKNKNLTEIAQKRLAAVRDFTELGAGFKIAMRDLEIRGAGNILGSEQHGHIAGVGFHEYCLMLESAIRKMKNEKGQDRAVEPQPILELPVDAYISDEFIEEPRFKLELYRRLSEMEFKDRDELLDEIIDRFGDPPEPVLNLWRVACIRALCRGMGIKGIHVHTGEIRIVFRSNSLVNTDALVVLTKKYRNKMKFTAGTEPVLLYRDKGVDADALTWLERELVQLVK